MQIFYGPNQSPGPNGFNYNNAEFNALHEKVTVMPDSAERTALYRKMEQIVVDDLPFLLTLHREAFVLYYPWLRNYKPHVFGYGLDKYQNIDVAQRRKMVGR